MKYAFTYIDLATGNTNLETSTNWGMWWDYERRGEIRILRVDQSCDNWETCVTVYEAEDMESR